MFITLLTILLAAIILFYSLSYHVYDDLDGFSNTEKKRILAGQMSKETSREMKASIVLDAKNKAGLSR